MWHPVRHLSAYTSNLFFSVFHLNLHIFQTRSAANFLDLLKPPFLQFLNSIVLRSTIATNGLTTWTLWPSIRNTCSHNISKGKVLSRVSESHPWYFTFQAFSWIFLFTLPHCITRHRFGQSRVMALHCHQEEKRNTKANGEQNWQQIWKFSNFTLKNHTLGKLQCTFFSKTTLRDV